MKKNFLKFMVMLALAALSACRAWPRPTMSKAGMRMACMGPRLLSNLGHSRGFFAFRRHLDRNRSDY